MNTEVEELIGRWPLIKEFKLPPDSIVVVIGAYKGLAMEALDDLYHPKRIVGYEPQLWAAQETAARLATRLNCEVKSVGLWAGETYDTPRIFPMGEWHTDACSFVNVGPGSREQGQGYVIDADWALEILGVSSIDLVVCNIEGYEFELLPYLREKGWISKINRLAVQWHVGIGPNPKSYDDIAEEIDELGRELKLEIDERPSWTYMVKEGIE